MKPSLLKILFIFTIAFYANLFAASWNSADVTLSATAYTNTVNDVDNNDFWSYNVTVPLNATVDINITNFNTSNGNVLFVYSASATKPDPDAAASAPKASTGSYAHSAGDVLYITVYGTDNQSQSHTLTITMTSTPTPSLTCANPKAFTPLYSKDNYSKVVQIGNTSLCKTDGSGGCADPGTSTNNDINMVHYDYDDVYSGGITGNATTLLNSSAAVLDIPAGKTILWAGLFWQGYMAGVTTDTQKEAGKSIKYKHANDSGYTTITNGEMNWVYFNANRFYYQSYINKKWNL